MNNRRGTSWWLRHQCSQEEETQLKIKNANSTLETSDVLFGFFYVGNSVVGRILSQTDCKTILSNPRLVVLCFVSVLDKKNQSKHKDRMILLCIHAFERMLFSRDKNWSLSFPMLVLHVSWECIILFSFPVTMIASWRASFRHRFPLIKIRDHVLHLLLSLWDWVFLWGKTALFDLCEILTRFSNRNILSCRDKEVSSCPFHCQAVCDKECEYKETSVVVVLSASVSLKLLFFTHSFIDSLIESSYKSLEVNHVLFTLPSFSKETAYFPSHDPSLRLHYFVYSLDLLSMMSRHKLSMPK